MVKIIFMQCLNFICLPVIYFGFLLIPVFSLDAQMYTNSFDNTLMGGLSFYLFIFPLQILISSYKVYFEIHNNEQIYNLYEDKIFKIINFCILTSAILIALSNHLILIIYNVIYSLITNQAIDLNLLFYFNSLIIVFIYAFIYIKIMINLLQFTRGSILTLMFIPVLFILLSMINVDHSLILIMYNQGNETFNLSSLIILFILFNLPIIKVINFKRRLNGS